ncbi:hypothetical protein GCM10008910_27000 [Faecalicatena orotica]|uniref:hypothetical protein n=1 Tax=Faecalicatena orotica TaxID=1544 RepID=UPI0015E818A1|nr:hypothetical protein [Faecalicatena orotica]
MNCPQRGIALDRLPAIGEEKRVKLIVREFVMECNAAIEEYGEDKSYTDKK